jgi:cytochrome c-type protein NapC
MSAFTVTLLALIALTIIIDLLVAVRPAIIRERSGKILAFAGLLVLPLVAVAMATGVHFEATTKTDYCLSCHVMNGHGASLLVDDPEFVPAAHFQNRRIPRDEACYTCHTEYTIYGGVASKLRGLRNAYVQYFGNPPDTLRLARAYSNRECLHCHENGRQFLEQSAHNESKGSIDSMMTNARSCIASGCHDVLHNRGELEGLELLDRRRLGSSDYTEDRHGNRKAIPQ